MRRATSLASEPVFAKTVAEIEPLIAAESGFSVTDAMSSPTVVTGIDKVQPTVFREPSGRACNGYELWREDVDLAAGMGLNAYRFSVEWARVEPSTIHALTHTREDATALRSRVTELERAVVAARELLGSTRLPIPDESASDVRQAIETHERVTAAYRALDLALPELPDSGGVETPTREATSLGERGVR